MKFSTAVVKSSEKRLTILCFPQREEYKQTQMIYSMSLYTNANTCTGWIFMQGKFNICVISIYQSVLYVQNMGKL